jgi:hypothetical protein
MRRIKEDERYRTGALYPVAGFEVAIRYTYVSPEWRSIHLYIFGGELPKRSYWFGWNGERTNHSRDIGRLEQHHPAIYEWLIKSLVEWTI